MAKKKAKPEAELAEPADFAPAVETIYLQKGAMTWPVQSDQTARIEHLKKNGFVVVVEPPQNV